ncbi:hypothetical protein TrST_g13319 [Triparma strigata]|uniref:PDZ domain-containing protein n=1 Tax=Triparma strigata TaxID=1606541 RepID=A0A9W6ZWH1_9STRA|nr:hypothetical protein TrST_g13319 [Triparma strigata]
MLALPLLVFLCTFFSASPFTYPSVSRPLIVRERFKCIILNPNGLAEYVSESRVESWRLYSSSDVSSDVTDNSMKVSSFSLGLPMGLILEDGDEGGVIVVDISETGSAAQQGSAISKGDRVMSVNSTPTYALDFDKVMALIMFAAETSETVEISLGREAERSAEEAQDGGTSANALPDGTPVKLTVTSKGKTTEITGKVGDNLRTTLLDNKIDLYNSMKKKLSNCGGGGQCLTCKVIVEPETGEWGVRSNYEDQKLKKFPENVRLACFNVIEGAATIEVEG